MTAQPRQPAGVPVGGQFTTAARGEAAVTLSPPAVGGLGIAKGDSMYLSAFEAGTDILESVEIVHDDDDGYRADGTVGLNFIDAYREITGQDSSDPLDPDSPEFEAAEQWLGDHGQILTAFVRGRYGADVDASSDSWAHQRVVFSVDLDPATDTSENVAAKLEADTQAVRLYNEMDAGTYGAPYLWAEARRHLQAWNTDVEEAQRGYVADVLDDAGLAHGHAVDKADTLTGLDLDASAANVRAFMRDHHDLIAQAKRAHHAEHGSAYEAAALGRDISLALHNPPGTPHGRMAFGALPGELQARLRDAVRRASTA